MQRVLDSSDATASVVLLTSLIAVQCATKSLARTNLEIHEL